MGFGELKTPAIAIPRLEKMTFMRWANQADRAEHPHPPKLGSLAISGWSSGMKTVFKWVRDSSAAANRLDAAICFDAVGAPAGSPASFPLPSEWQSWLDKKPGRKVAFLSGSYSQEPAEQADGLLSKTHPGRVLMKAPPALAFWYEDADYIKAHGNKTLPFGSVVLAREVGVKSTPTGAKDYTNYSIVLAHASDPAKTERPVRAKKDGVWDDRPGVAIHEATDFIFTQYATGTADTFNVAVDELVDTGDPNEWRRAGKVRHTWPMSGGTSAGPGLPWIGYLQQVLTLAKGVLF